MTRLKVDGIEIDLQVDATLAPSVLRAFAGRTPLDSEVDALEIPVRRSGFACASGRYVPTGASDRRPWASDAFAIHPALAIRNWRSAGEACSRALQQPFLACCAASRGAEASICCRRTQVEYMIEPIGAMFSNNDITGLAKRFTSRSAQGYQLHSVFKVDQPGCLGIMP